MRTIKLFDKKENLNWEYDENADVLYISIGKPQKALELVFKEEQSEICERYRESCWFNAYRYKGTAVQ